MLRFLSFPLFAISPVALPPGLAGNGIYRETVAIPVSGTAEAYTTFEAADVPPEAWYTRWVQEAYDAGLMPRVRRRPS